jgi:hypothetical protein
MRACFICQDTEETSTWIHPNNGTVYILCSYCLQSLMGVCAECDAILTRLDPIGVNAEGKRICYKCSAAHDMAEDEL